MPSLFDNFFGSSQPVRRKLKVRLTTDADGRPAIETEDGEAIHISPDGSIDQIQIVPDRFLHCGCNASQPPGGQCGEPGCNRISCQRCFVRCAACFKPLCLEHVKNFTPVDAATIKLCLRCFGQHQRHQLARKAVRTILSPFVSFDERK